MWIAVSVVLAALATGLAAALVRERRRSFGARRRIQPPRPGGDGSDRDRFLAAALDHIDIAVVLVDKRGDVVVRNRAAQPYRHARHGAALVEASIRNRLQEGLRGKRTSETLRLYGPPERIMQVSGQPIEAEGEILGALAVVDDATETERLDTMRRDFVANVSHELRTPVGAISLLAETLEEESDPAVVNRFATRIRHEMSRLTRLIDELLDLSRVEGGELKSEPVWLMAVLREAAAAVGPLAAKADVAVTVEDSTVGAIVSGDRSQIVSALTNLFENGVKYTEAGGQVTARLRIDGDEVAIDIEDTGSGIPARDLRRVFERFYRVDRGRSSESGGTGLGLSIVRHVAVNHGGHVDVESHEGLGSTFTLVLPIADATTESRVA